jgi:hypothetical protein
MASPLTPFDVKQLIIKVVGAASLPRSDSHTYGISVVGGGKDVNGKFQTRELKCIIDRVNKNPIDEWFYGKTPRSSKEQSLKASLDGAARALTSLTSHWCGDARSDEREEAVASWIKTFPETLAEVEEIYLIFSSECIREIAAKRTCGFHLDLVPTVRNIKHLIEALNEHRKVFQLKPIIIIKERQASIYSNSAIFNAMKMRQVLYSMESVFGEAGKKWGGK